MLHTSSISTTSDVNDTNVIPVLKYIEGSYSGEQGTFRGLDPVYLSFAIRNSGNRPVASGDQISAKILLSKDLNEDASDFILREFELGGSKTGGIGEGLLAGETINLTWFQQMPDNFEGDYYLIMSIDNVGDAEDELKSIESTPIITLSSQGAGTTTVLDTTIDGTSQPAERPDASKDGRFVTYEKTLLVNGEELQQIYIIDMEQPNPEPKLISRAYSSTSFFSHSCKWEQFPSPNQCGWEHRSLLFQCNQSCPGRYQQQRGCLSLPFIHRYHVSGCYYFKQRFFYGAVKWQKFISGCQWRWFENCF